MRKLKSILFVITLVCLPFVAGAGEKEVAAKPLFDKNEVTAKAFGTYTFDDENDSYGAGVGVSVFPFQKYFGVEASSLYEDDGTPVLDNVAGSAIFRVPIESLRLAPYAIGTISYNANLDDINHSAGGGVDFRLKQNVSVFADVQHRFETEDNQLRVGVGFTF